MRINNKMLLISMAFIFMTVIGCRDHTSYVGPGNLNENYYKKGDVIIWRPYSKAMFWVYVDPGICEEGNGHPSGVGSLELLSQSEVNGPVKCTVLKQTNIGDKYNEVPFTYYLRFHKGRIPQDVDLKTIQPDGDFEEFNGHVGSCGSCNSYSGFTAELVAPHVLSNGGNSSVAVQCDNSIKRLTPNTLMAYDDNTIHWNASDGSTVLIVFTDQATCDPQAGASCSIKKGTSGDRPYAAHVTHPDHSTCEVDGHVNVTPRQ
jgi:hypothetical protein